MGPINYAPNPGAKVVDLIRSLVDMFKCLMESDLWNALFSAQTLFTCLC